jgi:hypothetical protein
MGYILFPLTPALSLGEREDSPPSLCHTRDGNCQASVRKTRVWRWLFPLPEGQGEGNDGSTVTACRTSKGQYHPVWLNIADDRRRSPSAAFCGIQNQQHK